MEISAFSAHCVRERKIMNPVVSVSEILQCACSFWATADPALSRSFSLRSLDYIPSVAKKIAIGLYASVTSKVIEWIYVPIFGYENVTHYLRRPENPIRFDPVVTKPCEFLLKNVKSPLCNKFWKRTGARYAQYDMYTGFYCKWLAN